MKDFIPYLAAGFAIAVLMAMLLIPNILIVSYKRRLFDMPDKRKVHTMPVSRLGGVLLRGNTLSCIAVFSSFPGHRIHASVSCGGDG